MIGKREIGHDSSRGARRSAKCGGLQKAYQRNRKGLYTWQTTNRVVGCHHCDAPAGQETGSEEALAFRPSEERCEAHPKNAMPLPRQLRFFGGGADTGLIAIWRWCVARDSLSELSGAISAIPP